MEMKDRVEKLVDYIMKHCLWQFHSRKWDRERQNREILTLAKNILCDESGDAPADRLDRCHWADATILARNYKTTFPWINSLNKTEIGELMQAVLDRMNFLTITGSLNKELTDEHY